MPKLETYKLTAKVEKELNMNIRRKERKGEKEVTKGGKKPSNLM